MGLSTEIVSELGRRSGIALEIKSLPWEKAYVATQADKETCLYSTVRLDNRERLFFWIGPIATNKWVLIGKGDFAGTVKVVEDAKRYRVGVVAKDAKIEFLMSKGVTDLREVSDDSLNPSRLVLNRDDPNRIDLWATGAYGARRTAERAKVKDLKLVLGLQRRPALSRLRPEYLGSDGGGSPPRIRGGPQGRYAQAHHGPVRLLRDVRPQTKPIRQARRASP